MSAVGSKALNGIEEFIEGSHTFQVEHQTKVIANGLAILIYPANSESAEWTGKDTSPDGKSVSHGYRVQVYKATVRFQPGEAAS